MPKGPQGATVETTVEAMIRVYGQDATDEAKRMADRLSLRHNPNSGDFWQMVYVALRGPNSTAASDIQDRRAPVTSI